MSDQPSARHPFAAGATLDNPSTTSTSSSVGSSSLMSLKASSVSRKKPKGLAIKETRPLATPVVDNDGNAIKGSPWASENDRLRQDIARLALSSHSDSPPSSPRELPSTPMTHDASTPGDLSSPPAAPSSTKKSGERKSKKSKDKNGLELVKDEDLKFVADLGAGNGGTVTKVWNKKRKCYMARKLIVVDAKPAVRKQILRELQIMHDCSSPYIVGYYGCYPKDVHVGVVMEYMDAGSLDYIYRKNGPVPIEMVGKIAEAVLDGLVYLYDVHRIIHRDIKPSNILANTAGEIKLCDFGVSGELVNSIANTFVGTSTYMSPERIQGGTYTIKSDVWSLGISLIELALGRFPVSDSPDSDGEYDPDPTLPISSQRPKASKNGDNGVNLRGGGHTMSILDLLQHIVNEPAPRLVSSKQKFPAEAVSFVEGCLDKDPSARSSPQQLLASKWITENNISKTDFKEWLTSITPATAATTD